MADCTSYHGPTTSEKQHVWRVIDDATHVCTTADPVKALRLLQELLDKHEVTAAWVEEEIIE